MALHFQGVLCIAQIRSDGSVNLACFLNCFLNNYKKKNILNVVIPLEWHGTLMDFK